MRTATLKISFLVLFFCSFFGVGHSQVYPVQVSTQLLPPYSSYLPDYGDPTNEKLKCILVLQDFSVTHRDVKLEIKITGNGFTIQTSPQFIPSPITLTPGVPVLITSSDLAPYLQTQNLIFTGINAADYELRKILPEGYYSICIKAVDYYNTNYTVVSNESCNNAWFFLNDPPFLNYPICEEEIIPVTPQNIIFQWTAMNLNSPNSTNNTEYDFELYEIRPNNGIPNNIVQNSAPVFLITTTQPFFQYGITEPTLYLGLKYVWRVRARDLSGRDLFKNDGWSQICTFTYGNINSAFPEDAFTLTLQATASTHRQGKVWWNHIGNFNQYHVQVRKTGTQNWFDYYSTSPELKINELEPSTSYEARVMGTGNNVQSDWSNTATFTTNPMPEFACNDQTPPINALASNPLLAASSGMIFQIGQFEMRATQINPDPGAPGFYSGYGVIKMYMVNVNVQYNHVFINDNLQITSGSVNAITSGIEDWVQDWMIDQEEPIFINEEVETIIFINDSTIGIVTVDGDTIPQEFLGNGHPIIINDPSGDQYTVWPDGTIEQGTWMNISDDYLDATSENQILFSEAEDQLYGFDEYKHPEWGDDYEIIKLSDDTHYFVSNKSLKKDGNDFVYAEKKNVQLTFLTAGGSELSATEEGNKYKISLQGFSESGVVYAMSGTQRLGKLNVKVYEELERDVVLVKVGDVSVPNENELKNHLSKVFGEGVVKINLTYANTHNSNTWDLNGDGKLAAGNFNLLQDYSDEMKKLSNDWLNENETDKDAYVLFVINGFDEQNVDKGGYMPLGRHKGFIKSGSEKKIYAHELAHGIFGLEHIFPEVSEGSTNNLLDYSNGIETTFAQWEKMRWNWSRFDLTNDEEENYYSLSYINENATEPTTENPTQINCFKFLTKLGKLAYFDEEFKSKIVNVILSEGKLTGVTLMVAGVPKKFIQATAANYINNNNVKTINGLQLNEALICFDCLDEIASQVSDFTGPELCEVVQGLDQNNNPVKIYSRIPTSFLIDLRKYTKDCFPGENIMKGVNNGEILCHTLTETDCENFTFDGSGGPLTGEELVSIIETPTEEYYGSPNFSWINLDGKAIKPEGFSNLAVKEFILSFNKNGREYIACNSGSITSLDNQSFFSYVDKTKFLQKKEELALLNKEIKVKDLTDDILFKAENFTSTISNEEIHYRVYDRFGCYVEYYFLHDGRNEYELDGQQFNNVIRSVYWKRSCALEVLRRAICGTALAGTQQFAEFVGEYLDLAKIPESVYNPEDPDYSSIFLEGYSAVTDYETFIISDETSELKFAYVCGLINGVASELEGLVEAFPMIVSYVCDSEFRNQINEAISNINISEIQSQIEEDFQGNKYQKAEATGRYVVAIVSLVLPFTKINYAAKAKSFVSALSALPKKTKDFIRLTKNGALNGLKVIKGNIQKIIFVNAFNIEIGLARFTEDGKIIFNESRIVSEVSGTTDELFDFGEITYKTSETGEDITGEIKLVRESDGDVWVMKSDILTAKYPIEGFLDFVTNTFTIEQKVLFEKAKNFYSSFNPSFNSNELRGIDFDKDVVNVNKSKNSVMYQLVKLDDAGNPRFGSYFFEDVHEDITKLGIGNLDKIRSQGRVKVKIVLDENVEFLHSKTANIEDWMGSGEIFQGGGNQFYNPTAKTKIKSYEIIETY